MGQDYPIGPPWLQGLAQPPWFLGAPLGKPAGGADGGLSRGKQALKDLTERLVEGRTSSCWSRTTAR